MLSSFWKSPRTLYTVLPPTWELYTLRWSPDVPLRPSLYNSPAWCPEYVTFLCSLGNIILLFSQSVPNGDTLCFPPFPHHYMREVRNCMCILLVGLVHVWVLAPKTCVQIVNFIMYSSVREFWFFLRIHSFKIISFSNEFDIFSCAPIMILTPGPIQISVLLSQNTCRIFNSSLCLWQFHETCGHI